MAHPDEAAALAAIEKLRAVGHPALPIAEQALRDLREGRRDGLSIDVSIKARLDKYDGDYEPDKVPVETIFMEG